MSHAECVIHLMLDGQEVPTIRWNVPVLQLDSGQWTTDRSQDFTVTVEDDAPTLKGRKVEVVYKSLRAGATVMEERPFFLDGSGPRLCSVQWADRRYYPEI